MVEVTASYQITEKAKEHATRSYCVSPHSRTMVIPPCEEAL